MCIAAVTPTDPPSTPSRPSAARLGSAHPDYRSLPFKCKSEQQKVGSHYSTSTIRFSADIEPLLPMPGVALLGHHLSQRRFFLTAALLTGGLLWAHPPPELNGDTNFGPCLRDTIDALLHSYRTNMKHLDGRAALVHLNASTRCGSNFPYRWISQLLYLSLRDAIEGRYREEKATARRVRC